MRRPSSCPSAHSLTPLKALTALRASSCTSASTAFAHVLIQCTLLMQTVHWKTPVMLLSPLLAHHQCRSPEHDAFHMQPAQTWCLSGMHIGSCQGKSSNRVRWLIALLPGHKHMSDCDNTLVLWWQQPSKTAIGTASMPF